MAWNNWLGLTEEVSRYYDLPLERGVLITKVTDGSPAQRAGIIMGDIILRIDNTDIESIEDLLRQIHQRKVGEKVNVTVFRRGFEQFFEVTLSSMPQDMRFELSRDASERAKQRYMRLTKPEVDVR